MSQHTHKKTADRNHVLLNPNLLIIFSITLAAIMGVSSITPALPLMAQIFDVSVSQIAWLITIFTLPGIVLTPVLGFLSDIIGRKKVLVPSLFLFGVAGFACSFAQSYEQLLFFRFIQGVGVAAIGALNVTMIGDIFSGNERARAMGYNSGVLSFGATFYPAIGGALAALGWFYPFYLPLLAIPVALLVIFKLDNPEPDSPDSKTRYFKNVGQNLMKRRILLLFFATLAAFIILYGPILTMLPFLINDTFTTSSLIIGISLGALAVGNGISAINMGRLAARFTEPVLLKFSFLMYSVVLLSMPFLTSLWMLVLSIFIFGLLQGINLPVIITLLASETELESRGAIISLNGMVLRIAQTIAPVLVSLLFLSWGFPGVYVSSALFALLIGIWVFLRLDPVPPESGGRIER